MSSFDPGKSDDPIAKKVSWRPASKRLSTDVESELLQESPHRIVYTFSIGAMLKNLFFLLLGLALTYAWMFSDTPLGRSLDGILDTGVEDLIIGLVILGFACTSIYKQLRPRVFDRSIGWYWRGWRTPGWQKRARIGKRAVRLELIHALQLLDRPIEDEDKDETKFVFELNLVLKDATRINLCCHGDRELLRKEMRKLSRFLRVPEWDAS